MGARVPVEEHVGAAAVGVGDVDKAWRGCSGVWRWCSGGGLRGPPSGGVEAGETNGVGGVEDGGSSGGVGGVRGGDGRRGRRCRIWELGRGCQWILKKTLKSEIYRDGVSLPVRRGASSDT